jgi:hypothetical protein
VTTPQRSASNLYSPVEDVVTDVPASAFHPDLSEEIVVPLVAHRAADDDTLSGALEQNRARSGAVLIRYV